MSSGLLLAYSSFVQVLFSFGVHVVSRSDTRLLATARTSVEYVAVVQVQLGTEDFSVSAPENGFWCIGNAAKGRTLPCDRHVAGDLFFCPRPRICQTSEYFILFIQNCLKIEKHTKIQRPNVIKIVIGKVIVHISTTKDPHFPANEHRPFSHEVDQIKRFEK
jgi:hypothetical protein